MSDEVEAAVYHGEPATTNQNKTVMLRAEKGDHIVIGGDRYKVIRRTHTYYGPSLMLRQDGQRHKLFAPSPARQLELWEHCDDHAAGGYRKLAEVDAELEEGKQYDICSNCGEPIRTAEHETAALFGTGCPSA